MNETYVRDTTEDPESTAEGDIPRLLWPPIHVRKLLGIKHGKDPFAYQHHCASCSYPSVG